MVSGTNIVPDDIVPRQCPLSRQAAVPWTWVLRPLSLTSAALTVSTSCHQCWLYKNFHRLAPLETYPRINIVGGARESRKWKLGGEAIARLGCWGLRGWYWPMRTAGSAEFWCSRLERFFLPLHFAEDIKTGRQQLHLPCPDDNLFGSGNERVLEPSGLVWSSSSLCPWTDGGCYGRLAPELHAYSPLSSGARS